MDAQIQRSNSSPGGGAHVCRRCGWPFPKPHPSARHRRAHKKVCGNIEGYTKVAHGGEAESEDDSRGETLIEGPKSGEESARRGGSEEELFADAAMEFGDGREVGNVAIADAGNLYSPSSANGAQALTPERERAGIDTPLEQNLSGSCVDSVPSSGSDAKDGENSVGETANEATLDRKLEEVADEEQFGSDGKINGSENPFRATEDANEETGRRLETFTSCNDRFYNMVETDYLPLKEHSVVVLEGCEDQRTEVGETTANSEALLQGPKSAEEPLVEKKGEEAQQGVILADASARNFLDDIDSLAKSMKGVRPEADVTNAAREELALTSENFPAADNEAERKFEHESPVVLLGSKDAIHVENSVLTNLQESEAGNDAISSTDDNFDTKESIAISEGRDLDQGKQEETVAAVGFVHGDMDLVKENPSESESVLIDRAEDEGKLEDELPIASLESKDTINVENNVQKSLQESEAADDAISGTAGNDDSTQSLAITKERDLDQGEQEEAVAGSNNETRSIEENEGMISGLTDGDADLRKEEETVSGSSEGDRNLMKREEMATVSALDVQADTSSQTDSIEGDPGSVSAATETESQPPQAPAKVQTPILPPGSDNNNQEVSDPSSAASLVEPNEDEGGRNQGPAEAQTPQISQQPASGSPGSKRTEEIGSEKRHMPLKSFLGDSSPPRTTPAKETGQEWNSPARYPTNIKREKGKGRSRAWAPFICCSSARTS